MKKFSQQTGALSIRHGDFRFSYENDGAPFGKILGDNHDRHRTAAIGIGIGALNLRVNIFTGERRQESYEENGGQDAATMKGRTKYGLLGRIFKPFPQADDGGYGARLPFGSVEEHGTKYRFGVASIGYGNWRVGINSYRYVGHPIQNILAHYILSPQPGLISTSNSILPYFQYQTANTFTSW